MLLILRSLLRKFLRVFNSCEDVRPIIVGQLLRHCRAIISVGFSGSRGIFPGLSVAQRGDLCSISPTGVAHFGRECAKHFLLFANSQCKILHHFHDLGHVRSLDRLSGMPLALLMRRLRAKARHGHSVHRGFILPAKSRIKDGLSRPDLLRILFHSRFREHCLL